MVDTEQPAGKGAKDDAKGQFVGTQHGGSNNGGVSADRRALSLSGRKRGTRLSRFRRTRRQTEVANEQPPAESVRNSVCGRA